MGLNTIQDGFNNEAVRNLSICGTRCIMFNAQHKEIASIQVTDCEVNSFLDNLGASVHRRVADNACIKELISDAVICAISGLLTVHKSRIIQIRKVG